jgi:hypothetical protein
LAKTAPLGRLVSENGALIDCGETFAPPFNVSTTFPVFPASKKNV